METGGTPVLLECTFQWEKDGEQAGKQITCGKYQASKCVLFFPKSYCVEGEVPNAPVFRGGALGADWIMTL